MSDPLRIVVGIDKTEKPGTYAFCESVLDHASRPVSFTFLAQDVLRRDNSYWRPQTPDLATEFSMSRWLSPYLVGFKGQVLFCDAADMICQADVAELFDLTRGLIGYDCALVKHDYRPQNKTKFGKYNAPQVAYPKKLWSSLVMFFANTSACQRLTPRYISERASGADLHQFKWIVPNYLDAAEKTEADEQRIERRIYPLPEEYNWIPNHSEPRVDISDAKIIHWTEGSYCQVGEEIPYADVWHKYHKQASEIV